MTIGTKLRTYRKRIGLTQQKLADEVGVSRIYIQALESERRMPSMKLLTRLAARLETTVKDMMADYGPSTPRMQLEELLAGGDVDIWFRRHKLTDDELHRVERVIQAVLEAWDKDDEEESR